MSQSDVVVCSHCRKEVEPGSKAIGITIGMIVGETGFLPDEHNPWEVYCLDCGKTLEAKKRR